MCTYHQLLSNPWGFKINAIMKCGTYSTVAIMQTVYCLYCLIGSVKKNYCDKVLVVSQSPPPPSCTTCVDNHLCNMFVEFCHHAHLGVRLESGNSLTPDLSHTWPADVQYLSSIGREGNMLSLTSRRPLP